MARKARERMLVTVEALDKEMKHVAELIPSIRQISDPEIREKVAKAWVTLWRAGYYARMEDCSWLETMATKFTWPNYEHTEQVCQVAIAAAETVRRVQRVEVNMDYLIAAALLHDIDKFVMFDPKTRKLTQEGRFFPHGFYSAKAALDVGLPVEIAHMCSTHTAYSVAQPRTIEAVILHYADYMVADVRQITEGQDFLWGSVTPRYCIVGER